MAKGFSAEQYKAMQILAQPKIDRWLLDDDGNKIKQLHTLHDIADSLGIHRNTLMNWRSNEAFNAELKRAMSRVTIDRIPELLASMMDNAISGNAKMAELTLKNQDMLIDRKEVVSVKPEDKLDRDQLKQRAEELLKRANQKDAHSDVSD